MAEIENADERLLRQLQADGIVPLDWRVAQEVYDEHDADIYYHCTTATPFMQRLLIAGREAKAAPGEPQ